MKNVTVFGQKIKVPKKAWRFALAGKVYKFAFTELGKELYVDYNPGMDGLIKKYKWNTYKTHPTTLWCKDGKMFITIFNVPKELKDESI